MRLNWDKKSWENCLFPWIYLSWKNIVAMTTVQKSKFVYISVKNFPLVNFSRWIPILSKLRPNKLPPEKLPPRPNPTWKILTQKVLSKFKNKPARFKCVDLDIGYRVLTLPTSSAEMARCFLKRCQKYCSKFSIFEIQSLRATIILYEYEVHAMSTFFPWTNVI